MASVTTKPVVAPVRGAATRGTIGNNAEVAEIEKVKLGLADQYKEEEKVSVTGSPMYRPYFGDRMPISINGIYIAVPLDGRGYKIPESFAEVFLTRLRSVDDDLQMQKMLGDVSNNVESYAGERSLITLA